MTKKVSKKVTKKAPTTKRAEVNDDPLLGAILSTMHGDLTTSMLDELRNAEDTWQKLPESKQKQVIDRLNRKAENTIRQMFALVARRGFGHATATVKQVAFKDCAKISMEAQKTEGSHELADRINQNVIILFVDPEEYLNGGQMPEAEKDQADLI